MKESSRIWNELVMAKTYSLSIAKYTSRKRKRNQWIDLIIISISVLSIAGYYLEDWIPVLGIIISLVWNYAKQIFPMFKQSEEELVELDAILTFYESYYNRLEHFWYLHLKKKIDEDVLMSLLFREKEAEANKKAMLNKLQKEINEKDSNEAIQEAEDYINQVFKSDE